MKNLSKLFYKDYYTGITFKYALNDTGSPSVDETKIIADNNKELLFAKLKIIPANSLVNQTFKTKVCYPGLITGIGLVHDSKKIEGAFNLGMHFNHTYGMPIIYGSSVKGVLKHYFMEFYSGQIDREKLFVDIFNGENKSIYNRDIFFDAAIVVADSRGRILESDSITPHNKGPLLAPTPITFLKIASGCTIEFRFKLVDTKIGDDIFYIKDKIKLFQEIINIVGIGAKTNVGYGQFE